MRHLKNGRKLNRTAAHRKALMRNLVKALLKREQIRTTDAKAKELRRWADRIVTLGKKGTLHARRQAFAVLGSRKLVQRLFDEVAPRFHNRAGGYTRVLKLGPRRGDAAPLSVVEFTVRKEKTAEAGAGKAGG
ncbi:MAG: 50S ribosomal protein L17 [Thermodesulfobacteriota bacterium]|jgi:large subunit ribosomal protein L17